MVVEAVARRRAGRGLEVGQGPARVATREAYEVVAGVLVERRSRRPGRARRSSAWSMTSADVVVGQRLQAQQQAAREQRADDGEERVLGGRGDQRHPAVLHARQQGVLLGLGEAVHLVDEQDRLLAAADQLGARAVDGGADLLDAGRDRRDLDEAATGLLARRSPRSWSCPCPAGPTAAATSTGRPRSGAAAASRPPAAAAGRRARRSCAGASARRAARTRGVGAQRPGPRRARPDMDGRGLPRARISNKPSTSVSIPRAVLGRRARLRRRWSAWS